MTDTATTFVDRVVFLDCETVSLDPQPGSVWEIAVLLPGDDTPRVTQVRPDLALANTYSLGVGRFADRYVATDALATTNDLVVWLASELPDGAVLVGSNPLFDIAHLEAQLTQPERDAMPWHYHPCDLPSLVAGATGRWPDVDGSLSLAWAADTVGVDPDAFERHTAGGDVLLAAAVWRRLKVA